MYSKNEGKCSVSNKIKLEYDLNREPIRPSVEDQQQLEQYEKDLDVRSHVLFYPDPEQTLSYAASISFSSMKNFGKKKMYPKDRF